MKKSPLFLLLLAVSPSIVMSQAQPPVAINNQDEVVNVVKQVDADTANLTIFRSGDKAEINSYISEVVELQHAPGFEMLPHVVRAVRLEKGSARTLRWQNPETGETRHFIQIVTTREQMPSVVATVKALDLPGMVSSTGDMKYHYRLAHRRASEVADVLALTTLSGDGSVTFDDATNTLYFEDSQSDGLRNVEVIKFYDVPAPQVEFEIIAVEIEEANGGRLGLDWDAWKNSIGGQFQFTGNQFEGGDAFGRVDALMTVDAVALASFLNYTVATGTARVETRTVVSASNNRPAIFSSLRRIPTFGYTASFQNPALLTESTPGVSARREGSSREEAPPRTVTIVPPSRHQLDRLSASTTAPGASALDPSLRDGEKSEGIFLSIVPIIGREMVTADVRVVVNSLVGETPLREPIIAERLLSTRVALTDGSPFSLGGLTKESRLEERRGIPVLKDIPVLGALFSTDSTRTTSSRVYLVIRPRFNSQLLFNAESLTSSRPNAQPMNQPNAALPEVVIP